MLVIQSFAVVTNIIAGFVNPLFFIVAVLEIGAVVSLVMLLIEKGLPFLISYCACYGIASIVSQLIGGKEVSAVFIVGFIIGLAVNFGLTYLSAKNTFTKESK